MECLTASPRKSDQIERSLPRAEPLIQLTGHISTWHKFSYVNGNAGVVNVRHLNQAEGKLAPRSELHGFIDSLVKRKSMAVVAVGWSLTKTA